MKRTKMEKKTRDGFFQQVQLRWKKKRSKMEKKTGDTHYGFFQQSWLRDLPEHDLLHSKHGDEEERGGQAKDSEVVSWRFLSYQKLSKNTGWGDFLSYQKLSKSVQKCWVRRGIEHFTPVFIKKFSNFWVNYFFKYLQNIFLIHLFFWMSK